MKKLLVFVGITISNVSVIPAYAASLPVHPEDTSYPDGSGCASECYIPSGTAFSDTKGDGTYSSDCKY